MGSVHSKFGEGERLFRGLRSEFMRSFQDKDWEECLSQISLGLRVFQQIEKGLLKASIVFLVSWEVSMLRKKKRFCQLPGKIQRNILILEDQINRIPVRDLGLNGLNTASSFQGALLMEPQWTRIS